MKINPVSNFTQNFGKTLLGSTKVRGARCGFKEVNVVEYDPSEKEDIMQISLLKKAWGKDAPYIKKISNEFVNASFAVPAARKEDAYFYGLEDKNGKTLVIAEVLEANPDTQFSNNNEFNYSYINYLQADPAEQYGVKCKNYKGLGESLLVEIVKIAKSKNRAIVQVTSCNDKFWDEMKFFNTIDINDEDYSEKYLPAENFDNFIDYAENKKPNLSIVV